MNADECKQFARSVPYNPPNSRYWLAPDGSEEFSPDGTGQHLSIAEIVLKRKGVPVNADRDENYWAMWALGFVKVRVREDNKVTADRCVNRRAIGFEELTKEQLRYFRRMQSEEKKVILNGQELPLIEPNI